MVLLLLVSCIDKGYRWVHLLLWKRLNNNHLTIVNFGVKKRTGFVLSHLLMEDSLISNNDNFNLKCFFFFIEIFITLNHISFDHFIPLYLILYCYYISLYYIILIVYTFISYHFFISLLHIINFTSYIL